MSETAASYSSGVVAMENATMRWPVVRFSCFSEVDISGDISGAAGATSAAISGVSVDISGDISADTSGVLASVSATGAVTVSTLGGSASCTFLAAFFPRFGVVGASGTDSTAIAPPAAGAVEATDGTWAVVGVTPVGALATEASGVLLFLRALRWSMRVTTRLR